MPQREAPRRPSAAGEPAEPAPLIVPYIRECDRAVRKPWSYPERRLLDFLLIFVRRGLCVFTVDGVPHTFREGEFALIQPGSLCILEGKTDTETPFAHFDIFYNPLREQSFPTRPGQIDPSAYRHLLQPRLDDYAGYPIPVKLAPRRPHAMRDAMLRLVDAWMSREPYGLLHVQAAATELVAMILADHAPRRTASPREAAPSLDFVPSYLSLRLHEPISVEDMAGRAALSPSRFSALFKARFGVPPHRYLLHMRVGHACELLTTTSLSLEEIAAYCGFADVHHFAKTFKRIAGVTPGAWRKREKHEEREA